MCFVDRGTNHANITHSDLSNTLTCNTHRRGAGCVLNSVLYNKIEMNFLYMINDVDLNLLFKVDDEIDESEVLKGQLITKQNKLIKYGDAVEEVDTIPKTLITKIQKVENEIEEIENKLEECKVSEYTHKPEKLHFTEEIVKSLQRPTTSLSEEDLFELRIKTRQLIQQVVKKITVHAYPYEATEEVTAFLKTIDSKQAEEYLKTETTATQYIVELKNGMKQHIMFNPKEAEISTISRKWSIS